MCSLPVAPSAGGSAVGGSCIFPVSVIRIQSSISVCLWFPVSWMHFSLDTVNRPPKTDLCCFIV